MRMINLLKIFRKIIEWWIGYKKPVASDTIPHPEEGVSESTNANLAFNKWLSDWHVPLRYYKYWQSIEILVTENLVNTGAAAEMDSAYNLLRVKPGYCNPGVIAHEMAHESWSLLSEIMKNQFEDYYIMTLLESNKLINMIYSTKLNGKQPVEIHAEVYRYLGEQMPSQLTQFYPKLF